MAYGGIMCVLAQTWLLSLSPFKCILMMRTNASLALPSSGWQFHRHNLRYIYIRIRILHFSNYRNTRINVILGICTYEHV